MAKVEGHLDKLTIRLEVVVLPQRVELLVGVGVDDLVAVVPVSFVHTLVLNPLSGGTMVEGVHIIM